MKQIINFFKEEDGAALPEYAIILAVIAAVSIVMLGNIGTKANTVFTDINTKMGG